MAQYVHNAETGEVTELPDEIPNPNANTELAWERLRILRNNLLSSCDWTVLADSPTPTAAWKAYRQALRDLPANTVDPWNPVWPTPPS
jgi:hypothetical protein